MDPFRRIFNKLKVLFRRDTFDSGLAEEMAFHQGQAERAFVAEGMTPEEARHAARRQFGNATRMKEQSHEAVKFWFETVAQDFLFAVRQLRKNPGFTATAILMLGLGIGAAVAIFAFVDAALIQPLPYANPNRLVGLFSSIPLGPKYNISYLDYLDWKKQNKVFKSLEAYETWDFMLNTPTGTELAQGIHVSDGFFRTLGISPILGRDFLAGENQTTAPHTVLLSYTAWQKRFGGRQDVLGQAVILDGVPNTIIGVLPRDFHFGPTAAADFWAMLDPSGPCEKRRICHNLFGIARLKDGVSVQAADADMKSIAARLEKQYPDTNRGQGAVVMPLTEVIVGDIRPILLVLLSGAGLLLLIACVNVANLLLVRTESRQREIAVRGALGASPARLIRQFVTEGLLLVGIGGVLGVAWAYGAIHLLIRLIPADMLAGMPYLQGLGLNLHSIAFAGAVTLAAGTLFALTPVLRMSLQEMRTGLTEGGRSGSSSIWRHLGANLVVIELAVAVVLLVGAGLLSKSLYRLLHVEVGFQPDHLAAISIGAPDSGYSQDTQAVALEEEVSRRIESLPGVQSVGVTRYLPLSGFGPFIDFIIKGRPYHGEHNEATRRQVSARYLTTLQAQLLHGRYFTASDDASRVHVAIINQAMSKKYFPNEDPIGKQIVYSGSWSQAPPPIEIVGVVGDVKEGSLGAENYPAIYLPFKQEPADWFSIVVRSSQAEQSLLPTLITAIHRIDPGIAVYDAATMNERIQNSETAYLHRSAAWLVGGFAAMALLLSVVGLYGVIAYSVRQRTREIGVRMALGAQRSSIYQMILQEAGRLVVFGIAAGMVGAVAAGMLMRSLLFDVRYWDLPTLAVVAMVLSVAALVATYIPARGAASVNPVEALRAE
ncbi:MAG: ABC transporter permease [Acidobacteriaceae bacterium]